MWVVYYEEGNKYIKKLLFSGQSYQVGCSNGAPTNSNFISLDSHLTVRKKLKIKVGRVQGVQCMEPKLHTPILIELQAPGPVIIDNLVSFSIDLKSQRTKVIAGDAIPISKNKFSVKVIDFPGVELIFYWIPFNISYTSASQKQMHLKKKLLLQQNIDFRVCNFDDKDITHMVVTNNVALTSPVSPKILWCLLRCTPVVKIEWLDHVVTASDSLRALNSNDAYVKTYSPSPNFEVNLDRKKLLTGTFIVIFVKDFWSSLLENMGADIFEINISNFQRHSNEEETDVDELMLLNEVHRLVHGHLDSCYFLQLSLLSMKQYLEEFIKSTNSIIKNISACFGAIPISSKQIETCLLQVSSREVVSPQL